MLNDVSVIFQDLAKHFGEDETGYEVIRVSLF